MRPAIPPEAVPEIVVRGHGVSKFLGLPLYDMALMVIGVSMTLTMVRLLRGPTLADRVVALDLLAFFAAGGIAVIAMGSERPELLMVAIVVALLTFMGTAAFAMYLERQGRETHEQSLAARRAEGGGDAG